MKTMFDSSLPPFVCKGGGVAARVLFMVFVLVAHSGVHVLTLCMSNMMDVLQGAGTAYPSRAHEFTSLPTRFVLVGPVAHLISFLCCPIMYLYFVNSV